MDKQRIENLLIMRTYIYASMEILEQSLSRGCADPTIFQEIREKFVDYLCKIDGQLADAGWIDPEEDNL